MQRNYVTRNSPPGRDLTSGARHKDGQWSVGTTAHVSTSHRLVTRQSQLCSSRHSRSAALNTSGWRPSRHSIFNAFKCFRSTAAVTAFVPMSAVLCPSFRFFVRISPEYTSSINHCMRQCRCRIRPAPRLSMILLVELLSVPRTHCPTSWPKFFTPNKIDPLLTPCVELRLSNTQGTRTLRPTSGFEQVDAMEKTSTRRALLGKHASIVIAVGVLAWCLHVPLLRDHLREPAVIHKVSN